MSLLEDEESGDEIHRVNTATNFLSQASAEVRTDSHDRQAPPKGDGKKEKKAKQSEEHRKGGSLTLPWRKDKDKDKDKEKEKEKEEKQSKRTKHSKSKSPPLSSPKSSRAADKKALKAPPAPQPHTSPNAKASRKPYAQLSADEEDEFEELVANVHSVNEEAHERRSLESLDLGEEIRHTHHHIVEGRSEVEPTKRAGPVTLPSQPVGPLAMGARANAAEATSPVVSGLGSPVLPPPPPPVVVASLPAGTLASLGTSVTLGTSASTTPLPTSAAVNRDTPSPVTVNSGDPLSTTAPAAVPVVLGVGFDDTNPAPDSEWLISDELREKCHKQFTSLNPEGGLLSGEKARDFFIQSKIPTPELALIWQLADHNCDNALSEEEFLIAMKLVLVRRKGFDIPAVLPPAIIPQDSPGPPLSDLLLISGEAHSHPIHPPAALASGLLPSVGLLDDLSYAPVPTIGSNLEDFFASQPILAGDFTADPGHPDLSLLVPSLDEPTVLNGHMGLVTFPTPAIVSENPMTLATDDLLTPAHVQPAVGELPSFEPEPPEDGLGTRGDPAVGELLSFETEPPVDSLGTRGDPAVGELLSFEPEPPVDGLGTRGDPAVGELLSFEPEPPGDGLGTRGDPAIGELISLEPSETIVFEPAGEGGEEEGEEDSEEPIVFKPRRLSNPEFTPLESSIERVSRDVRIRHSSTQDEERPPPPTSPIKKKSKSLRTPVRPAPPVPGHPREKPSGGVLQGSPACAVQGAEPSVDHDDHTSSSMSSMDEKLHGGTHEGTNEGTYEGTNEGTHEGELADDLGMIAQGKHTATLHFDPNRAHGRSASLDLNKMFTREEVHEGLPSATPPKPPPKPFKPEPSEIEVSGGYLLVVKSASTGSISNAVLAAAELLGNRDQDVPPTTTTTTTSRPKPLLPRAKVLENMPPQKKPGATVQISTPSKEEGKKESVVRNKQELQTSIQQYKETNATLTAINKELETALFKLIADRVELQQKLELLKKQ